ncbi:50S ribosomal protein L25/general stress protein Ctc [Candidatus Halobeggiatoa sp. HSG11]|nr:50S ribosomal protein L25/general stress protein Ctc [Candidatus Halobeggiatoa sp. HSG11]
MENFEINAQRRTDKGKGASRRLRRTGYTPAIIYGSKKDPVPLTIKHNELAKHLEHEAFYSHILTVNIDNQPEKVVLKDVQRHPYRPIILHIDLQRVSETEKVHMRVPLHFLNEEQCIGVKQGGGVVSRQKIDVEIHCLPKDLPEFIEIDLASLDLNQIVHISDLALPEGVSLAVLTNKGDKHDLPVVSVHLARGDKADEEEDNREDEEGGEEQTEEKPE